MSYVTLIRRMSKENPLWGAPRILGRLLKLGFRDRPSSTVSKYMIRARRAAVKELADIVIMQTQSQRSPWLNPYVERLIGTLRRDCLDHVDLRRTAFAPVLDFLLALLQ